MTQLNQDAEISMTTTRRFHDFDNHFEIDDDFEEEIDDPLPPIQTKLPRRDIRSYLCFGTQAFRHLRNHWKILAFGQVLSLCLAGGGAAQATLKLDCDLNAPSFTIAIFYFFLSLHLLILLWRNHQSPHHHRILERDAVVEESDQHDEQARLPSSSLFYWKKPLWQYFMIALIDVSANAVTMLSFRYTTLTSVALFDNIAIPASMLLSKCLFSRQYTKVHLLGVIICMVGVFSNIIQDYDDDKNVDNVDKDYPNKLQGDILAVSGGILYGITNVFVEITLRDTVDPIEYLGTIGFFGFLLSATRAFAFEWQDIQDFLGHGIHGSCQSERWWLLGIFVTANVFSYVGAARFFLISEATFFSLSLLTGDLWSVIFSIVDEHRIPHPLFFFALFFVLSGMFIYEMAPSPVLEDRRQEQEDEQNQDRNVMIETTPVMEPSGGVDDEMSEEEAMVV